MYIINLWGGPGSGKSTTAALIFAYLKNQGARTELVHEAAKRFIYKGAGAQQLKNQLYVFAKQQSAIEDLRAHGCQVAISDSPLLQNTIYCPDSLTYQDELVSLWRKLEGNASRNIYIVRTKQYDNFGRNQATVDEARVYDAKIRELFYEMKLTFDYEDSGDPEGQIRIAQWVSRLVGRHNRLQPFFSAGPDSQPDGHKE